MTATARRHVRSGPRHLEGTSSYLPVEPFRDWLLTMRAERGTLAVNEIVAAATGSTVHVAARKVVRYLDGTSDSVHIDVVDRVTLFVGGPDLLREMYPLDGESPTLALAHINDSEGDHA